MVSKVEWKGISHRGTERKHLHSPFSVPPCFLFERLFSPSLTLRVGVGYLDFLALDLALEEAGCSPEWMLMGTAFFC